jgi:exosome complex component RRP45
MPRPKDISNNEQEFVLGLLRDDCRLDNRRLTEFRNVEIEFGESYGHCEVKLGNTRLIVQISAEVGKPYDDRPYEGTFMITTDVSSMASPMFENFRQSDDEVLIARLIEKAVRRSTALDLENLCISGGKSCWNIRADVHYLDYDGGLVDATCIGVMAALLHFRRPDTTVEGEKTLIHTMEERAPVPLSVLHVPVCVTFSFVKSSEDDGELTLVDATAIEEALRHSEMTLTVNKNRDLCQISKPGGLPVEPAAVLQCADTAYEIAVRVTDMIREKLKADDERRNAGNIMNLSAENSR